MVVESMILRRFIHSSVPLRRLSDERLSLFCSYRSRYTSSKNFSERLAFASDSVLRRGTVSIPTWCSLRTSAVIEASISRNESKRMMTAYSIVSRCVYPSKLLTYLSPLYLRLISTIFHGRAILSTDHTPAVRRNDYFCSWLFMVCLATPK